MSTTATPSREAATAEVRFVSNRDESCRMFRSDLLERLSHVHPVVPHLLFIPVVLAMVTLAVRAGQGIGAIGLLVTTGLLVWTVTEYVIHRYAFHPPQWVEDETRAVTASLAPGEPVIPALPGLRHKFYFLVHGVHHDYPNDSTRLVMPPSVSIPLSILFFLGFQSVLGGLAYGAFAGFMVGYLFYDTTHYMTHNVSGKTALGRYQKKRHFRHHYADSEKDYGVSSPLWDAILGTMGRSGRNAA